MALFACSGPVRSEQINLALVQNVHGYNEFGGEFIDSGRVTVLATGKNEGVRYVISLYDSWLVLTGKPTQNPYWYKSDDAAVKIRLVRRTDFVAKAGNEQVLAAAAAETPSGFDSLPMSGHISVEKTMEGYRLYADLRSPEAAGRNNAWLSHVNAAKPLTAARMKAVPGDLGPMTMKGSITTIEIFQGW